MPKYTVVIDLVYCKYCGKWEKRDLASRCKPLLLPAPEGMELEILDTEETNNG